MFREKFMNPSIISYNNHQIDYIPYRVPAITIVLVKHFLKPYCFFGLIIYTTIGFPVPACIGPIIKGIHLSVKMKLFPLGT